tara:strand:- start:142 stop:693 length:552 start_codon:yes stop_codon:yes gene_type:complete
MISKILAVAAISLAASICLRCAGTTGATLRSALLATGWGLLLTSYFGALCWLPADIPFPIWIGSLGIVGFMTSLGFAWHDRRDGKKPSSKQRSQPFFRPLAGGFLTLAVSSASLLSLALSASLCLLLPIDSLDRSLFILVLWPVIWCGLLIWLYVDASPWRTLSRLSLIVIACAAAAYAEWLG